MISGSSSLVRDFGFLMQAFLLLIPFECFFFVGGDHHFYFPALRTSRALLTGGVCRSPPPGIKCLPHLQTFVFIAQRVHPAFPLLVDCHQIMLTHALALSATRKGHITEYLFFFFWTHRDSNPRPHALAVWGKPLDHGGDRLLIIPNSWVMTHDSWLLICGGACYGLCMGVCSAACGVAQWIPDCSFLVYDSYCSFL